MRLLKPNDMVGAAAAVVWWVHLRTELGFWSGFMGFWEVGVLGNGC